MLFYFTIVVQETRTAHGVRPQVVVDVTAFQWNWKFGYQNVDFKDGTLQVNLADNEPASGRGHQSRRARAAR